MLRPSTVIALATLSALLTFAAVFGAARALPQTPSVRLAKAADGHFWALAQVGGRPLRFLVDTGATSVALTRADARALGLDPAGLVFDHTVTTAAGRTRAAAIVLPALAVDQVRVEQVPALVGDEGRGASLLGMSWLGRLSGFSADRDALVLRR